MFPLVVDDDSLYHPYSGKKCNLCHSLKKLAELKK